MQTLMSVPAILAKMVAHALKVSIITTVHACLAFWAHTAKSVSEHSYNVMYLMYINFS